MAIILKESEDSLIKIKYLQEVDKQNLKAVTPALHLAIFLWLH